MINMRGVKESVTVLVPIFVIFLVTHAILLIAVIGGHLPTFRVVTSEVTASVSQTVSHARASSARSSSSFAPTRSEAERTPASRRSPTASA